MVNCSSCGAANRSNSRYCRACGVELELVQPVHCPQCGTPNPATSAFCSNCEARLPRLRHTESNAEEPEAADMEEPARIASPGAGGGTFPVWVRGPDDAIQESTQTAEREPKVDDIFAGEPMPGATPAAPASPASLATSADEPRSPEEEPQDEPPVWLKELPTPEALQTSAETASPAVPPPDWLEPLAPRPSGPDLELAMPTRASVAAGLPGWLRSWHHATDEADLESGLGAAPPDEAVDEGELRPLEMGQDAGDGSETDQVGVQSDLLASEATAVSESRGVRITEQPEPAGDLLAGVDSAIATAAVISAPSAPGHPAAPVPHAAIAASQAHLFSQVVSSQLPATGQDVAEEPSGCESILALDCGNATTRAFLFDRVDGAHRFIACREAPSSAGPPSFDPLLSVGRALSSLADTTGEDYLDEDGRVISPRHGERGVDALVAVQSVVPALRLVLAGDPTHSGLDRARHAASVTGADIVGTVSLEGGRGTAPHIADLQEPLRLIERTAPDAILFVADGNSGDDAPVVDALRALSLACSAQPADRRPALVFVGDGGLQSAVAEAVGSAVELRLVDSEQESPPERRTERIAAEIEKLGNRRRTMDQPALRSIAEWSAAPVLPASRGFALSLEYLARRSGEAVVGLDIGAAQATVVAAANGRVDLLVRSDLGLAHNAPRILRLVPPESVLRWLPFEADGAEVANGLYNKALRPGTLPQTPRDLLLEQAAAREIIRLAMKGAAQSWPRYQEVAADPDLIVGSGGVLAAAPSYGQAALILVDALQPVGVTRLYLDRDRLAMVASAVAMVNPLAASQILEGDGLVCLGTVVAPTGLDARDAEEGASLTVRVESGGDLARAFSVPYGSVGVVPLAAGQTATVEVLSASGSRLPLGDVGRTGPIEIMGGAVGVMVDARGRPLAFADDPAEQWRRARGWLRSVGA